MHVYTEFYISNMVHICRELYVDYEILFETLDPKQKIVIIKSINSVEKNWEIVI